MIFFRELCRTEDIGEGKQGGNELLFAVATQPIPLASG